MPKKTFDTPTDPIVLHRFVLHCVVVLRPVVLHRVVWCCVALRRAIHGRVRHVHWHMRVNSQ